jgi:hypothetical protein
MPLPSDDVATQEPPEALKKWILYFIKDIDGYHELTMTEKEFLCRADYDAIVEWALEGDEDAG